MVPPLLVLHFPSSRNIFGVFFVLFFLHLCYLSTTFCFTSCLLFFCPPPTPPQTGETAINVMASGRQATSLVKVCFLSKNGEHPKPLFKTVVSQQLKKGVFGKGSFRSLCAELCFVFFCVLSGFSPANLTEISFRNCPSNAGIFWKTPSRKTPKRSC